MALLAWSSLRAAADLVLIAAVAALTLAAGVASCILLLATLIVAVFFLGGMPDGAPHVFVLIWCPVALVGCFYIMIRGVEEMSDPDWGQVAFLAAVAATVALSSPFYWDLA